MVGQLRPSHPTGAHNLAGGLSRGKPNTRDPKEGHLNDLKTLDLPMLLDLEKE
jgi:hypothetical protein